MESGASPNPRNSAEELTGYPARRDKRVAAGTLVPGPITRRETAVCHKRHVRWCVRGRKPPTRLLSPRSAGLLNSAHLRFAAQLYKLAVSLIIPTRSAIMFPYEVNIASSWNLNVKGMPPKRGHAGKNGHVVVTTQHTPAAALRGGLFRR